MRHALRVTPGGLGSQLRAHMRAGIVHKVHGELPLRKHLFLPKGWKRQGGTHLFVHHTGKYYNKHTLQHCDFFADSLERAGQIGLDVNLRGDMRQCFGLGCRSLAFCYSLDQLLVCQIEL